MLYLLDANVLITANNSYYPVDRVPEYWEWLLYLSQAGYIKMPIEIFEEVKDGPKDEEKDLLFSWIQHFAFELFRIVPVPLESALQFLIVLLLLHPTLVLQSRLKRRQFSFLATIPIRTLKSLS